MLFAPEGGQTITAVLRRYSPISTTLTISNGLTHALDLELAAALLSATPDSLAVTLDMGDTADQSFALTNNGERELSFLLRERNGEFLPTAVSAGGQGTWLYRATEGVVGDNNLAKEARAYPAAYRWQPAQPTADLNILLYADDPYHPSPNTYPDQALQTLGLPYTAHYDADFEGFRNSLNSGTVWDIVFANDNWGPPSSVLDTLNTYALSGGRLIYHSWTVGFTPDAALFTTLGFGWQSDDIDPPDPVYWWEPAHPIFTQPQEVPQLLSLNGQRYFVYGQQVEPLGEAEALAGYLSAEPAPGQSAQLCRADNW